MATVYGVFGPPASGKSTGLYPFNYKEMPHLIRAGLNPKHTMLVDAKGGDLPMINASDHYSIDNPMELGRELTYGDISDFNSLYQIPVTGGNYSPTTNPFKIVRFMRHAHSNKKILNFVVENFNLVMNLQLFDNPDSPEWEGDAVFKKYRKIGWYGFMILNEAFHKLNPADRDYLPFNVIFTAHSALHEGELKIKVGGQMLHTQMEITGLFNFLFLSQHTHDPVEDRDEYYWLTRKANTAARAPAGYFVKSHKIPNDMSKVIGYVMNRQGYEVPEWYRPGFVPPETIIKGDMDFGF